MSISDGEKRFISNCVSLDSRIDGRRSLQFRSIHIQRNVVSQATGSSHVRLGNTEVYVGIKVEIGEPTCENPDCGKIEFFVDYVPCGAQAIEEDEAEMMGHDLAGILAQIWKINKRTKKSGGVSMQDLCVLEGKVCFVIFVDVTLLSVDGHTLGAISMGILSAIHQLPIPQVEVSFQQDTDTPEIEIDDEKSTFLDTSCCPVIITVGSINEALLVDMSSAEEATCHQSLHIGVSKEGTISGLYSNFKSSLNPEKIEKMVELARRTGMELQESLRRFLEAENDMELDRS